MTDMYYSESYMIDEVVKALKGKTINKLTINEIAADIKNETPVAVIRERLLDEKYYFERCVNESLEKMKNPPQEHGVFDTRHFIIDGVEILIQRSLLSTHRRIHSGRSRTIKLYKSTLVESDKITLNLLQNIAAGYKKELHDLVDGMSSDEIIDNIDVLFYSLFLFDRPPFVYESPEGKFTVDGEFNITCNDKVIKADDYTEDFIRIARHYLKRDKDDFMSLDMSTAKGEDEIRSILKLCLNPVKHPPIPTFDELKEKVQLASKEYQTNDEMTVKDQSNFVSVVSWTLETLNGMGALKVQK